MSKLFSTAPLLMAQNWLSFRVKRRMSSFKTYTPSQTGLRSTRMNYSIIKRHDSITSPSLKRTAPLFRVSLESVGLATHSTSGKLSLSHHVTHLKRQSPAKKVQLDFFGSLTVIADNTNSVINNSFCRGRSIYKWNVLYG